MANYDETSNWLQDAIPIMPKTPGSGPEGTKELMSLASPLLAAMNITPVGRGIGAAVATLATIPEASEAGIFQVLGRTAKKGFSLLDDGAAVFPDMTRNIEFPTNSMAGAIAKGKGQDMKNLADYIRMPSKGDLTPTDITKIFKAKEEFSKVPTFAREQAKMLKTKGVSETTHAFFQHPGEGLPHGKVVIRRSLADKTPVSYVDMAGSYAHEFTHASDVADDPIIRRILDKQGGELDYNFNLGESRAFMAGYRGQFDRTLTDPASRDFLHPMLSYADGEVSMAPFDDYVSNMRTSYKAIGKSVDDMFIAEYKHSLGNELKRIQAKVNMDDTYKMKLDKATIHTTESNAAWNLTPSQKKRLDFQQVEAKIMKQREEIEIGALQAKLKEIDKE